MCCQSYSLAIFLASYRGRSGIGIVTYILFSSLCYSVFGSFKHVMPLINNFVYIFASILLVNSLKLFFLEHEILKKRENVLIFLLLFYPGAFSNCIYNLRDAIIIFFFVLFLRIILFKENKIFTYWLFYFSIFSILVLRPVSLIIITAILSCYLLFLNHRNRVFFILLSSLLILFLSFTFQDSLKSIFSIDTIINTRYEASINLSRPYPVDFDYSSLNEMVANFFIRFFYFLFYPFPWAAASYNFIIPTLDSIFHTFLVFSITIGIIRIIIKKIFRNEYFQNIDYFNFLFFSVLCCYFFLAFAEVQFGGAIRHRIPVTMFLCLAFSLIYHPIFRFNKIEKNLINTRSS